MMKWSKRCALHTHTREFDGLKVENVNREHNVDSLSSNICHAELDSASKKCSMPNRSRIEFGTSDRSKALFRLIIKKCKNFFSPFTFNYSHNFAFTLAELLITIGVIGLVATLVLPRFVAGVQDIAWGKAKENTMTIIGEATKQMKSNDVLAGYTSNADFMNVFSKYIQIVKQCDSTNLGECFTPTFKNAKGDLITTSTISAGTKLNSKNLSDGTISFMLKNGTTLLFSLKDSTKATTECARIEPYDNQSPTTACMSFLYDINGNAGPNIIGKDIGNLSVTAFDYALKLPDGTKLGYAFLPKFMTAAECNAKKGALGIASCYYDNDYWAGAVAQCGGVSKIANDEQLAALANYLYNTDTCGINPCYFPRDNSKTPALGLPAGGFSFDLWSSGEYNPPYAAQYRGFSSSGSAIYGPHATNRNGSNLLAICIVD